MLHSVTHRVGRNGINVCLTKRIGYLISVTTSLIYYDVKHKNIVATKNYNPSLLLWIRLPCQCKG